MNAAVVPNPAKNGQSLPGHGWSRAKMLRLVAVVLIAHLVLIFIFGARKPIVPRQVKDVPQLTLADSQSELFALTDPTLFALPHVDEFTPPYEIARSFNWSIATNWLTLTDIPTGTFNSLSPASLIAVDRFGLISNLIAFKPVPKMDMPTEQFQPAFAQNSTLRLEGDLAQRRWLAAPQLPSWISDDVLQPSIVQVLVDTRGDVVSGVLLGASGLDDADQKALGIARGLHFVRASQPTFGRMIFDWRTLPAPATNAPPTSP
jgi:hypothetical protein